MAKYGICCSKNGNFIIVLVFNIFLFTHWKTVVFSLSVLNVIHKFSPFRASCPSLKYQIKNDYLKINKALLAGWSNRKDHVNKGRENERKSGEKSVIFVKKLALWAHIISRQEGVKLCCLGLKCQQMSKMAELAAIPKHPGPGLIWKGRPGCLCRFFGDLWHPNFFWNSFLFQFKKKN